jgi:hypothetical protein
MVEQAKTALSAAKHYRKFDRATAVVSFAQTASRSQNNLSGVIATKQITNPVLWRLLIPNRKNL